MLHERAMRTASCMPMIAESSHGSRWHNHRQQQRNVIIHAAGAVFADVGYDRANMHMVAERAGVAKPTLYAYFRGKSALLEAVIEYWLDAVPPPALEYRQGETLRLQLDQASRELLRQTRHPASLAFDQMLTRSSLVPAIHLERWRQRYSTHLSFLQKAFADRCYANDAVLAASQFVLLTVGDHDLEVSTGSDEHRAVAAVELFVLAGEKWESRRLSGSSPSVRANGG